MSYWSDMSKRAKGFKVKKEDTGEMKPMEFEKLNRLLKKGIVHFRYRKKSKVKANPELGEERETWGTKNIDIIGLLPRKPGEKFSTNNTARAGYINYWDCEAGGWRCFDPDRIIDVEYHVYQIEDLDFEPIF
jgi:hypothetical protein